MVFLIGKRPGSAIRYILNRSSACKMSRSDAADPSLLENEGGWYHERFSLQPDHH